MSPRLRVSSHTCAAPSVALDGIVRRGYYRSIAQSRAYTMREWSRRLEILDYLERGLDGSQDLVVMRRR